MAIVTKESLQSLLENQDRTKVMHVIGRALVVLFNNQTEDEKAVNATAEKNSLGFTGADAHSGTLTAKSYLKNKHLQEWQIERWLKKGSNGMSRLTKYHKQLNVAAEAKTTQKREAKNV